MTARGWAPAPQPGGLRMNRVDLRHGPALSSIDALHGTGAIGGQTSSSVERCPRCCRVRRPRRTRTRGRGAEGSLLDDLVWEVVRAGRRETFGRPSDTTQKLDCWDYFCRSRPNARAGPAVCSQAARCTATAIPHHPLGIGDGQ